MRTWFRVRYDDQGRDLAAALHLLDGIARRGRLEVLWIVRRQNPALLVGCDPDQEALLHEGLINALPGARLTREAGANVDAVLSDVPKHYLLSGPAAGPAPFPQLLLMLGSDVALRLSWDTGRLGLPDLATREERGKVLEVLRACWPGASLPRLAVRKLNLLPSQVLALPSSGQYPTLASRNVHERPFASAHTGGLLLGSDVNGEPVAAARPMRLAWVGAAERVDNVCTWLAQRWAGRILVLDASPEVGKGWQDVSRAEVMVSWNAPGRSAHVNPLSRLPQEGVDPYVGRVLAWLAALGINQALMGGRVLTLVRAMLRLLVHEGATLSPPQLLALLSNPGVLEALDGQASQLPEDELAIWRSRDWRRDAAWLAPGASILRGLFDQVPELALWVPPYTPVETMLRSPWTILRVGAASPGQRAYWAGCWPLLGAVYGRPDVLVLGLGLRSGGQEVLGWAERGASVLAWGRNLPDAVGLRELSRLGPVDAMVGAGVDPGPFVSALRVLPQVLAAQAEDQATLRLGGDVGSLRLRLPEKAATQQTGWNTAGGVAAPALVSVLGDEGAAREAALALVERAAREGRRLFVLGKTGLWPDLKERVGGAVFLTAQDLPMLNPLSPRPPKAYPWVWWGAGLGIPAELMQGAYRDGKATLQGVLAYVQEQGDEEAGAALCEVLRSGLFGEAESNPGDWFAEASVIAVETLNPAVTRTLAVAAVGAGARLVCWHAPGLAETDVALLQHVHGLIYPDALWVPDVLVTRVSNGLLAVLPDRLQAAVRDLPSGHSYLYRRGQGQFSKIVLQEG